MRISPMLALVLLVGITPLKAQVPNKSESRFKTVASEGGPAADVAIDLVTGTFGFGLYVSKLVTPHLGVRAGGTYFSFNRTVTQTDVEYSANLKLETFSGLVDFFPSSRGAFHLTGGVVSNQSTVEATGNCSGTFDINNHSYTCSEVGKLAGSVTFPSLSPYLGFGVGTPAMGSRVHFVLDIGGAFGAPDLTLTAANSGNNAQLAADMKAQRDKTQSDINKYLKVFPVIVSGIGIRF